MVNKLSMGEIFTKNRKEKKELQKELDFWDLVYYARELREWPEDYKDRFWKERIFYRKLVKAIPELSDFKTRWVEPRHRVTHNHNILQIVAIKNSTAEEDSIMQEDDQPGPSHLFLSLLLFAKEVKSFIKSISRNKAAKPIIYFKENGDVRLELSNDKMEKKYGIIINHDQKRAKVLYKCRKSPESKDERGPDLYGRASIEELSYFLVRSGIVEMHSNWE
jgi:hypothetical protein